MRLHTDLNHIPRLQKLRRRHRIPHTRTRARHKHGAFLQRSPLTAIRHERRNLEAQIIDAGILAQFAIHPRLQLQNTGIGDNGRADDLRAERRVRVEAL